MGTRSCAGRDTAQLRLPRVSRAIARDLRSASRLMGPRRRKAAEPAGDCRGGHAASHSVWIGRGGDAVARSGGAAAADCEWNGAWHRLLRAQRGAGGAHAHAGRVGHGDRRGVSQREPEAGGRDSGRGRGDCERGADGDVSRAAEFSPPQSHFERAERGRAGGGGERELGHAGDRPLRRRAEPRPLCRAGQRDQQRLLDA